MPDPEAESEKNVFYDLPVAGAVGVHEIYAGEFIAVRNGIGNTLPVGRIGRGDGVEPFFRERR